MGAAAAGVWGPFAESHAKQQAKEKNPGKVSYLVTIFKEKILKSPFFSGVEGGADLRV